MYKISVPISANRITEENKIEYLSILKRCGISRVFLCGSMRLTDTLGEKKLAHIKSCIDFFTANDIETGVWISTLGHGIVLTHFSAQVEKPYTRLKTAQGDDLSDTYCPLMKISDTRSQKPSRVSPPQAQKPSCSTMTSECHSAVME